MSRIELTGWLVGRTRGLLAPLAVSVVARIANQLLGVALFVVIARAVGLAASGAAVSIGALVGWLVGIALVKAGLRYLEHYSGHGVAFTALQRLREQFFDRLVPQAPAATAGRAGAELTERATRDIDRIEVFFAHTFPPAVSAVAVPVIALVWLAAAGDAALAGAIAPFILLMLVVPFWSGRSAWRSARRVAAVRGGIAAHIGGDVQGIREVLAFDIAEQRLAGLDDEGRALTAARAAAARRQAVRTFFSVVLQMLAVIAPVVVGLAAGIGTAEIAVAAAVAVGLWIPARGVDGFVSGLDASFAATERVREVIEGEPLVRDAPTPGAEPRDSGIVVDAVTVRHRGQERPALDAVDARFADGAWTVVVGVSGSGKSTLAALLARGLDPETGSVRLGGADVRELPLDDLRRRVSLVAQHPTLLSGTISDNLRLASPDATDVELADALAVVALDDWIATLPQGVDTPVRERGLSVSGGQLQRLALARAIVASPDVLVLDEALSQLDAATGSSVRARLAERRSGLTVVEVTHRADLVDDDAPVIVLDNGRIVEAGSAARLRAADGAFARLEARG